jgi:hypothetical protein
VQLVDGHGLEATERRLKVLRDTPAGAVPGQSLTVTQEAARSSIANALTDTYKGRMMAISEPAWGVLCTMSPAALGATLLH